MSTSRSETARCGQQSVLQPEAHTRRLNTWPLLGLTLQKLPACNLFPAQIHFLETLHALAGRIAGTSVPDEEEHKVREMLYPRLPSKDASDLPKYGVSHFYAALYVQAAMRGFLKRHALKDGGGSFSTEQQEQQQQRQCRRQSTLQRLFRLSSTGSRKQHGEQTAVQLELPPAEMRTLSDGQQP